MSYAPKHSRNHANSEYVSFMGADCKGDEFLSYRQTDSFTHSLTNKYTDTLFYILVQIYNRCLLLLPSIEFVGFTCVSRAPAVNIYVIHFQLVLGFDM